MYTYTWYQWLMFFYLYCFFGWIFESTYVSIRKKRFVNRGFMHAPMLPLYGSGAIIILFVAIPVRQYWYLVYLFGALAATLLEYVTGVAMEAMFKVRYWDYSNQKFNFQGQICLSSTIAWGFLSLLLIHVIHKPIETLVVEKIPVPAEFVIVGVVSVIFVSDMAVSFREAWQLRTLLEKMTEIKEDVEQILKRLEAASSEKKAQLEEIKEESLMWLTDLKEENVERMNARKKAIEESFGELGEDVRLQMSARMERLRTSYQSTKMSAFTARHSIIKRNPTAVSTKFSAAMNEYKNHASGAKKKGSGK